MTSIRQKFNISVLVYNISTCALFLMMAPVTALSEGLSSNVDDKADEISKPAEKNPESKTITRVENTHNPCDRSLDKYDYDTNWYDSTQTYVNSVFCEPALWFDNFFATDRVLEEVSAGTYVRWRNEFVYDEEEHFDFDMGLSASVELPYFSEHLRLTFDSEDADDDQLRDVDPGSPGGVNPAENNGTVSLRYDVKENDRSKLSLSVTPSPRVRVRYRYTYPATDRLILRATPEVQWRKGVNSGRLQFDLEQLFASNLLFRSSTEAKVSEEYKGVDWLQALIVYQRLNRRASMSYELSANGITEPVSLTTNYRAAIRYRQNFHRPWLFFEVAPEYTWPITLDGSRQDVLTDRRSKWLLFFRLEVHFGNAYQKGYGDYH